MIMTVVIVVVMILLRAIIIIIIIIVIPGSQASTLSQQWKVIQLQRQGCHRQDVVKDYRLPKRGQYCGKLGHVVHGPCAKIHLAATSKLPISLVKGVGAWRIFHRAAQADLMDKMKARGRQVVHVLGCCCV